jgi:hypothetical protein
MNLTYFIFIILTALLFFMFFYFRWYIKRRTSVSGQLEEYRTEVNKLKVEINSVTERNLDLIEDKVKKLKELVEETDKRVSVYVGELEKSRRGEALYTSLGRGIRAALRTEEEPAPASPLLSPVRPHDVSTLPVPPPVKLAQTAAEEPPPSKTPSKRQIRTSIDLLLNEGLSPDQVASRLDISIAEVNLAMNLRRSKH